MQIDYEESLKNISFSYWEKVSGYNRSVIADSSIRGRYHIFSHNEKESFYQNYLIVDFYESIRCLDKFDPNHCPLLEIQTDLKGNNYFLQYHKCRDFEESSFTLTREKQADEFEAILVRGATSPDGKVLNVTRAYHELETSYQSVSEREAGSFNICDDILFSEIMSRRRCVDILPKHSNIVFASPIDHLSKTLLFKAQISIICEQEILTKVEQIYGGSLLTKAYEAGKDFTVPVKIVSDGRKAYLEVLKNT